MYNIRKVDSYLHVIHYPIYYLGCIDVKYCILYKHMPYAYLL